MMPSFEYIDSYFKGDLGAEEKKAFDDRITGDEIFAEEVAFYLSTLEAARTELAVEKKKRFRELYQPQPVVKIHPVKTFWRYAAAAAVIIVAVVGAYYFLTPTTSGQQLAKTYINEQFAGMSVQMDSKAGPMQDAKALFNEGKYAQAQQKLDRLALVDPANDAVLKMAGITALKAGNYEGAISYFSRLQAIPGLHANYGKFYTGITLLRRNGPGDLANGNKLLQDVVDGELAGKEDARELLNHL